MKIYEGNFLISDKKIAIIISRFNDVIGQNLLEGALDQLKRHNIKEDNIDIYWVPGAFEIPFITKKLITSKKYDGVITLGCVIRGETTHYEVVSGEVGKGIAQLNLQTDIPIIFGVLTVETLEQAFDRAGGKQGNNGSKAALSLVEMMTLTEQIK